MADLSRELAVLRRRAAGTGQVQLSVREIAKKAGKAPSTLDPYLRGQRLCPEDTFEDVLRALGVPNDRLGPWLDAWERVAAGTGPRRPSREAAVPICDLPWMDGHFTGRTRELASLTAMATAGDGPRLCIVYGLAGVGKTALAVHAAAALGEHFPDGTFFVDLHGYTEGRSPLSPAEALDRLLRRLGVDGGRVPVEPDERAALWRSLAGRRRLLVVLDNARDVAQVRPLLLSAAGCAVILTSRRALVALDDADPVPLDALDGNDAIALFRAVAGADRLRGDPAAEDVLARVVERCARIPLAVRIAAARHRASRVQTLAELEVQLSAEHTRLAALDDGDRSVAASFQLSLVDLPPATRRTFALLAVHPGADIDVFAAAALVGEPLAIAVSHLQRLVDRHLLGEYSAGRYQLHDLIAVFASEYGLGSLPPAEQSEALRRVVNYYLHAADLADRMITPQRFRVPLDFLVDGALLPALRDFDTALDWLNIEHRNLTDACLAAGSAGLDAPCWQLAYTLRGYYFLAKHWQPWIGTYEAALAATRRHGDLRGEAMITNNLGLARFELGHHEEAATHYQDALRLFIQVGDRHGEYTARGNLAWIRFAQQRYAQFLEETEPVVAFYRQAGAERNAAITQRGIGLALAALGRTAEAVDHLEQALAIFTDLDLRLDTVMTLNGLGETYHRGGEPRHAVEALAAAVTAGERCGSLFERARAHHGLGQLAFERGEPDQAREFWELALADYQHLGAPQAVEVEGLLAAVASQT